MSKNINITHQLLLAIILSLAIVFSISIGAVAADQSQIYVNPTGNDSWDGQYATWQNTTFGPKLTIKNATATVLSGGTIHIANGTYNENNIADYNKNINFVGESRENTIINGTNTGRIFTIGAQGVTYYYNFTNLTLTNGNSTAGGAIWNYGSTTIDNCIIQNNVATYSGGAIYSQGTGSAPASLTVTNSEFINNTCNMGGVFINSLSTISVTNSDFINNHGTTSILYNNYGSIGTFQFNRIIGTGNLIYSDSGGDLSLNWWGSNSGPAAGAITGSASAATWLNLTTSANPTTVNNNDGSSSAITSTITADFQHDQFGNYYDPSIYGHIPDGLVVNFSSDALGNVNPLSNNLINGAAYTTFTAGPNTGISTITATADGVPASTSIEIVDTPLIISVDPANGSFDVPVTKQIIVTFSKAIQAGSAYNNIKVLGNINYLGITKNIVGNTLIITPTNYWDVFNTLLIPENATVGLLTPLTSSFFTAFGPVVTSVDPADGAVNVPLNKVINVTFDRLIVPGPSYDGITLTGPNVISFTKEIIDNSLIITPTSYYNPLSTYLLTIPMDAVTDLLGGILTSDFYSSFTTLQLAVTSVDPVSGAINVPPTQIITVTFNEVVKAGNMWIELKNNKGTIVPTTLLLIGNVLTITPNNNLTNGLHTLALHTGCVYDLAGNPLALWGSNFTVRETTPPTVTSIDPAKGAINVPPNKIIKITFSEPVKAGNMWIELKNNKGTIIPTTLSLNNNILTITPNNNLTGGLYTLALHTGCVYDLAGNPLALWGSNFTVDTTSPTVVSSDPANNTINVPTNKIITVTFNENIKAGNMWIELRSNKDGTVIPVTSTINGNILTVTPNTLLANNTTYTMNVHSNSVQDLAGNPLKTAYIITFKTIL